MMQAATLALASLAEMSALAEPLSRLIPVKNGKR